ncbi:bifunctional diaminohydroxyphosphoribosylaminopyrimidine deaminase/5-amino-6-(5-phosphoribosylamino)uracil reductase RibD [Gracilibacillus sp. S3-1-1]|uniref:Bifunctional diaminohydroxyphosphoribosylaminopyrimidine deaminase/5-amino-6-(5-phosphoribosylamino)uracil reductase RibD n=1 Tax=Gracilibacillus pellucidus TaxID=3095368 RepID=A0ACC6M630_9BACI|nr:bifunctional diaminohydroxyphosphoribosylaminopyrimidine deaminase/5-amino-6-(5-phosphoribosylamino)uracil reductase RibD [Gracilibacillus sp. S3-1-1]MDX8046338.1 bifunctional diaminohydroxyphosphoribosylaminopyrimidine deaminase/5-amino-6-(5-phosphoribosylamino)uracil reductase RibD [Gracilibacillus sp. S3-1-1]
MKTHEEWMDLALNLAEATIGQTSPNPSVGAVVVKDGELLGVGTHLKAGGPHAEVHAINQAGERAKGADVYVTLEPCSHYGKTPPCAELLVQSQVKKVYIACLDPNPKVTGNGVAILKQAGIEVEIGIREERALQINQHFFHYMNEKRPFITLKAATTLDGKTATATGDSKWITSQLAREDVHKQRHQYDAILVGRQTVEQDNPSLTTRLPQGGKSPIRIILDTHLSLDGDFHIFKPDSPTWIVCGKQADKNRFLNKYPHVKVIQLQTTKVDIADLMEILAEEKIESLYVEGGASVHQSFVQAGLFDECHWYIAPKLLGGDDARAVIGGTSPIKMAEAEQLVFQHIEQMGPDIKIIAKRKEESSCLPEL